MAVPLWETMVEICRKILKDSLKPEWLLSESELPPADQLDVSTFIETCKRLTPPHQLTNLATEFLVENSLRDAAELDAYFAKTGKLMGPLHGIPISVKEHVNMKGRICHAGYTAFIDNIASEDAVLLQLLRAAGAVFHVRTNVPQSLMQFDCSNLIYGTTVNPFNRKLTSGGSSGGEGAILGLRGSVLGIGTDIGGSVKVPAAINGGYGLQPTALRNPLMDIVLFQQAVIDQRPWDMDSMVVPLPWKRLQPAAARDFTVGVMWDDGIIHPHPPITRGMKYAVEKLEAAGVKVVDFEPHQHEEGWDVSRQMYFPDGGARIRQLLAETGEKHAFLTDVALNWVEQTELTSNELSILKLRREGLWANYHQLMKDRGVDFILCPNYVGVAPLLDHSCLACPTGLKADPAIDVVGSDYTPRSAEDSRDYKTYVPEAYAGAPIGLQFVGKRFCDEETVAAALFVSKIVQS
ncbi:fatty-acid amide hydrolase [Grosmannia clavigera kw1407]|uniref:Fatty-acid amide hydrolase n=1 Tax=Grosmannia clavigera (strain kw1407 / UAMH 11150) TaxID=655863 RepID=F0XAM7_GROCL|nr:fatty-acid amide hydrolase [Grosmannia clavigera kw1407]EFX05773.1 fatty-acid amide hydrolase [Grosmannia clavigera kw1407]